MCASPAFADGCDTINSSETWKTTFGKLNEAYAQKDWNAALRQSRELENYCDQSPILNYTIAQIYKNKGDEEKYLFYLTKATQNTERFSLDKDLLDKIWSEKYIAAHPEAAPEKVAALQAQVSGLEAELSALKQAQAAGAESQGDSFEAQLDGYRALMWTGVGIGAGGIAMAVAGAVLVATMDEIDYKIDGNGVSTSSKPVAGTAYNAGWGLIGAGAAFAIAGAVVAGIGGYKYTHALSGEAYSFRVLPGSAWMTIEF